MSVRDGIQRSVGWHVGPAMREHDGPSRAHDLMQTTSSSSSPPRLGRPLTWLLFLAVVVAIPLTTTTLAVDRLPALSRYDEFAHIDYLRRIEEGEIPRIGEKILPDTARDVACRTIGGRVVVPCETKDIPLEIIDAQGYSYQAQQPPLYYAVTAILRQPFRLVVNDFVNAARLTGMVWTAAALCLLWWFLRSRMAAGVVTTALVCGLLAVAPPVVSQSATVNNDAAGLLIGVLALVGYDVLRRDQRPATVVGLCVGAIALVLLKPLAILPIGAVTLGLLLAPTARASSWRTRAALLLPALVAGVTYQGWQVVRDARAITPYSVVVDVLLGARETLTEFPYSGVARYSSQFFSSFEAGGSEAMAGVAATVALLLVYAPSIATALGHGRRELEPLHVGLLVVVVLAPMLLIAQSYFTVHKGGGANARYAIALLPLFMTALVSWLDERRVRRLATLGFGILFVVTMISLVTAEP